MTVTQSQSLDAKRTVPWIDFLGIAFIALLVFKTGYSFQRVVDIAVSDEGRYLGQGVRLLELGFPSPQWAPLYALWYFLLSKLPFARDTVQLYYLSYSLLSFSVPVLLYIYLRRISVYPIVALLTSWLYLVSYSNLGVWPYPTKFAALCLVVLLIVATFLPRSTHYTLLTIVLLVVSFVRPEYAPAFVIAVLAGIGMVLVRTRQQGWPYLKAALPKGILVAALTVTLVALMGDPLAGTRNLDAFSQHFSMNYVSWTGSSASPWVNNAAIMREVFGKVETISQVARNNPGAFGRHVFTNAVHYPGSLLEMVFKLHLSGQLRSEVAVNAVNLALGGLALLTVVASVVLNVQYRRKRISLEENKTKPPLLPALHQPANKEHVRFVGLLFLFVSMSAVASSLLIYPRYHYLQIQALLLLILGALFISNTAGLYQAAGPAPRKTAVLLSTVGIVLLLITPSLAFGWMLGAPKQTRTDVKNTIFMLRDMDIKTPVNFVTFGGSPTFSYDIYLGENYHKIPSTAKAESFDEFLKRLPINMVVWPEQLLFDARFQDDDQFKAFIEDPQSLGFLAFVVPESNGQRSVFVKSNLTTVTPPTDNATTAAEAKQLYNTGQYEEAIRAYRTLVENNPKDQSSRMGLAESLAKAAHADEAMVEYDEIIREWPRFPWVYIRRGELLEESGDYEAAIADYQRAATLAPDLADPHFRLGFVYLHNGDREAAIREFEAGLQIDPGRERPRKALEALLAEQ